jgi:hypothetical protein
MKRLTDWFDRLTSHKDVPSLWSDSVLNDNPQPSQRYVNAVVWCVLIFLGAIFGVAVYGIWRAT